MSDRRDILLSLTPHEVETLVQALNICAGKADETWVHWYPWGDPPFTGAQKRAINSMADKARSKLASHDARALRLKGKYR